MRNVHGRRMWGGIMVVLVGGCLLPDARSDEQEQIKSLVQSLVSKNPRPPRFHAQMPYVFPEGFDHKENRRVTEARDALLATGVAAFPHLIEALDDERYSWSQSYSPKVVHHFQVRETCMFLLEAQVEVYVRFSRPLNDGLTKPRWLPAPEPSLDYFPENAKSVMQKWWVPRQTMTLNELQREAVEWAIQLEGTRGYSGEPERLLVLGWYKRLDGRLKSSEKALRVALDRTFPDEMGLQPTESDWERWLELRDGEDGRIGEK